MSKQIDEFIKRLNAKSQKGNALTRTEKSNRNSNPLIDLKNEKDEEAAKKN